MGQRQINLGEELKLEFIFDTKDKKNPGWREPPMFMLDIQELNTNCFWDKTFYWEHFSTVRHG